MMNEGQKKQLIEAAIYAPSADNSQPFLVDWSDSDDLYISLDPALSGKATDSTFILSDLALGCVIESISLESTQMSLDNDIVLFPDGEQSPNVIAKISFKKAVLPKSDVESILAQNIPLRCTDRRFPFTGTITNEVISNIKSSLNNPACKIINFTQKEDIQQVIPTIYKAEKVRFECEQLHQELFNTVVFHRGSAPSGMNLDVLGIKPFETMGFKWMSHWKVMKALNALGASKQIAKKSVVEPISQSPGLLLLTTSACDRAGIVNAGRQLQRIWLACTANDLAVQIYAAPGVLSLAMPDIPLMLKNQLLEVKAELGNITGEDNAGIVFFRIGKIAGKPARTQRRSIDTFYKN